MKQLRNLAGIVALSAMGIAGCGSGSTQSYRIDGADVTLERRRVRNLIGGEDTFLSVARGDTVIAYTDLYSDGKLNRVEINPKKQGSRRYRVGGGEIDKTVLAKAQEQFIGYLGRIAEIDKQKEEQKKQEALKLLGN